MIHNLFRAQRHMITGDPAHRHGMATRGDPAFIESKAIGRVVEERVAARLGLFGQTERAVGIDIHGPDRVHLEGHFERHGRAPLG